MPSITCVTFTTLQIGTIGKVFVPQCIKTCGRSLSPTFTSMMPLGTVTVKLSSTSIAENITLQIFFMAPQIIWLFTISLSKVGTSTCHLLIGSSQMSFGGVNHCLLSQLPFLMSQQWSQKQLIVGRKNQ